MVGLEVGLFQALIWNHTMGADAEAASLNVALPANPLWLSQQPSSHWGRPEGLSAFSKQGDALGKATRNTEINLI